MNGIPTDLDLTFLHGAELAQVCLGQYQLQFHFHPIGSIAVEGHWELRDATGAIIDHHHNNPDRPPYHLHRLLGQQVVTTPISAPDWFALHFTNGDVLRVFQGSPQYESFQIEPGNIIG